MKLRSTTENGSLRCTLARGRVLLYGRAIALAVPTRRHNNTATLHHICSAVQARLHHNIASACRQAFQENPLSARMCTESPGTYARLTHAQTDRPAPIADIAERYERTTVRWRSGSVISESVQNAVAQLGPSIIRAIRNQIRTSGEGEPRPGHAAAYAKYRSQSHRSGERRFDPLKHPRAPSGRRDGGQFVDANEGTSPGPEAVTPADSHSGTIEDDYTAFELPGDDYPELLLADSGFSSLALQLAVASLAQIEHRHHIFPREFESIIDGVFQQADNEFNIDDFITRVDKLVAHKKAGEDLKSNLHAIGESASKGGYWNSNLKLRVTSPAFEKLTAQQRRKAILESILKASNDLGFDLTDLTKWGKDSAEDNAKSLVKFLKICSEAGVDQRRYGKQMGKLVAKCLATDVGRQMLHDLAPEIVERFVKGGIKGMLKNGARAALKKSFGPLSAFMIAMAMQNGEVEAAVAEAAGIPPESMDQLKAIAKGDANFDFGTLGLEAVDSAGALKVGQPAEVSVDGKAVGYAHVVKILDAGDGWYYVTISGEKARFLQMKFKLSNTKKLPIPEGFPYFRYLPELQVPAPAVR